LRITQEVEGQPKIREKLKQQRKAANSFKPPTWLPGRRREAEGAITR
jgi:hypothetical protein